MKVLGIYGAGGLGREICELAKIINNNSFCWDEIVFISDFKEADEVNGVKVFSLEEALEKFNDSFEVVVAVGEPAIRKKLFENVKTKGVKLATLVHPNVCVPNTVTLGEGTIIQLGCFISTNITIGDNVMVQPHVNIGHDDIIGNGCVLSGFSNLGGNIKIGDYSYIGLSACLKQGVTIGRETIISMGAVVYNDIPDNVIVLGNPARPMRTNTDKKVFK